MPTDLTYIPERQAVMHGRLENWARFCRNGQSNHASPMFRLYRSGEQWEAAEPSNPVDFTDGMIVNELVKALQTSNRLAVHWFYIERSSPWKAKKRIGVTLDRLAELVIESRDMMACRHSPTLLKSTERVSAYA